jgi:hypothetical protein
MENCPRRPANPVPKPGALSSGNFWSWRRDLNPRPSDYKSDALPAELRQQARIDAQSLDSHTNPFFFNGTIIEVTILDIEAQAMLSQHNTDLHSSLLGDPNREL